MSDGTERQPPSMITESPTTCGAAVRSSDLLAVPIRRYWSNPNSATFQMKPALELAQKYLMKSKCSIDPFARNSRLAMHRNDLNPDTEAEHHMDALDFLKMLVAQGVKADLIIFDPPYSRAQVKEVYNGIGRHYGAKDTQDHSTNWRAERDELDKVLEVGGVVLSCGWNSNGMGLRRGYWPEEIRMIRHGGAHNDTIIIAEKKRPPEDTLWTANSQDPRQT
jgi:hypothetical protein